MIDGTLKNGFTRRGFSRPSRPDCRYRKLRLWSAWAYDRRGSDVSRAGLAARQQRRAVVPNRDAHRHHDHRLAAANVLDGENALVSERTPQSGHSRIGPNRECRRFPVSRSLARKPDRTGTPTSRHCEEPEPFLIADTNGWCNHRR